MRKIEIERKFLLKSLPNIKADDKFVINQYYLKNKSNIWERARTYHSEKSGDSYIHTIKKQISKSVNLEDENEMSELEFLDFKKKCEDSINSKFISKERYIYNDGDLKWEVDVFGNGYNLVIAELEIPKKSFRIKIPDFIHDVLLIEVTGLKQFSNKFLSLDMNKLK
jgi:CYTH domain-containing protein